jgi:DNA-binding NarL/FixJ family response regulator
MSAIFKLDHKAAAHTSSAAFWHGTGRAAQPHARQESLAKLTDRENEVLPLMAQAMPKTGIAERLALRERTVEAHVRHLLLKLDIADGEDAHRRILAILFTSVCAEHPRETRSGSGDDAAPGPAAVEDRSHRRHDHI